ncbi:hypothetical protein ONR49_25815, partial [Salmonella enterica subsp. enterica serovar Virginia]|nr:hypothetical protein [Salmonella enterica subsp. enterica serovar Virginia]
VTDSRRRIEKILNGEDPRLLVVIGPCSIHDLNAAMEYATQLHVGFETNSRGQRVPVFRYYNVNKARIQGVETELKVPFNEAWKL